jgi:hypothetical protein
MHVRRTLGDIAQAWRFERPKHMGISGGNERQFRAIVSMGIAEFAQAVELVVLDDLDRRCAAQVGSEAIPRRNTGVMEVLV